MSTVDLVIENGKIVGPNAILEAGIAVDDGKIVSICKDDKLPSSDRKIDAKGNFILPGIIDTHTHFGNYFPYEDDFKDTFPNLYGGVTTIANYMGLGHTYTPAASYKPAMKKWIEAYNTRAFCDAVFHLAVGNDIQREEMEDYIKEFGVNYFKFFAYKKEAVDPKCPFTIDIIDDGDIYYGFREVARLARKYPIYAAAHAENNEIVARVKADLRKRGGDENDLATQMASRPSITEALDVYKLGYIALATGAPYYVVHLTSKEGLDAVIDMRKKGANITVETCSTYLTLNEDNCKHLGALGVTFPSIKDKESNERLWQAVKDGTIQCVATDATSTIKSEKKSIWTMHAGSNYIETHLPVLLSEGVNKGRITIQRLVEVCSRNTAKALGLYPMKGTVSVGSDADLVIVDLKKEAKVSIDKLHSKINEVTYYDGWELKGWPVTTIFHGNVAVEDEQLLIKPGTGQYINRSRLSTFTHGPIMNQAQI